MRSLLILPLLASANFHDEWETDAHVSLLQHQAHKVLSHVGQKQEPTEEPAEPAAAELVTPGPTLAPEPPVPEPQQPPPPVQWSYANAAAWKTLPGLAECGGGAQSPIDVNRHVNIPRHGANVQAVYKNTPLTQLENDGHALLVKGNFGTLQTQQGIFTANEVKFHFPSEHTFDGVAFDGEMHIIHTLNGNPNTFAVVAVPLKVGRPLSYQFDALHAIGLYNYPDDARLKPGEKKALSSQLDLSTTLKPQLGNDFYQYKGSLSAPPCRETTTWFVSTVPMKVGWRMPTDFNLEFGGGNSRPTQPVGGRQVFVNRFIPATQPFAPEPDPPAQNEPENQAPPQNNDDVLTGAEAEAEAQQNNDDGEECEPGAWCTFAAKDMEPLIDDEGDTACMTNSAEQTKACCDGMEACIGWATEDHSDFWAVVDADGEGPFMGEFKPVAAAPAEPEVPAEPEIPDNDIMWEECTDCVRAADGEMMGFCGQSLKCVVGEEAGASQAECVAPNTFAKDFEGCKVFQAAPAEPEVQVLPAEPEIPDNDIMWEECTDCVRAADGEMMGFCGQSLKCVVGEEAGASQAECVAPNTFAKDFEGCKVFQAAPAEP